MNDLISALTSGIGNINGSHGGPTGSELSGSNVMVGAATSFLNSQYYNNARPVSSPESWPLEIRDIL